MTPEEKKELIKKAHQEWLDQKFAELGKYALKAIVMAVLSSLFLFYLSTHGWKQ